MATVLVFIASVFMIFLLSSNNLSILEKELENTTKLVYADDEGNPKYAQGDCQIKADCQPAGCSMHVCSNNPELITTCELVDDFPDKEVYKCGCIENRCLWYELVKE